jgi:hypothetical protein
MGSPRQFRINSGRFCALLLVLLAAALAGCARGTPRLQPPDLDAPHQAVKSVMKSMGGVQALDQLRYLHFFFVLTEGKKELARREQWWDRQTGAYRMETVLNGKKLIAVLNVNTGQGQVFEGNLPHPVERQAEALREVLAWQSSDAQWLLAPLRLSAPGAQVEISGAQMIENVACPTLFLQGPPEIGGKAALADRYWFHLDPQTSRPAAWSLLQPGRQGNPTTWLWKNWQAVGRLWLPTRYEQLRGKRVAIFDGLYSPGEMNPLIFKIP